MLLTEEPFGWDDIRLVIGEWLLLEYAYVSLPADKYALVEAVAKGELPASARVAPAAVPFTSLEEVEAFVRGHLAAELPDKV